MPTTATCRTSAIDLAPAAIDLRPESNESDQAGSLEELFHEEPQLDWTEQLDPIVSEPPQAPRRARCRRRSGARRPRHARQRADFNAVPALCAVSTVFLLGGLFFFLV